MAATAAHRHTQSLGTQKVHKERSFLSVFRVYISSFFSLFCQHRVTLHEHNNKGSNNNKRILTPAVNACIVGGRRGERLFAMCLAVHWCARVCVCVSACICSCVNCLCAGNDAKQKLIEIGKQQSFTHTHTHADRQPPQGQCSHQVEENGNFPRLASTTCKHFWRTQAPLDSPLPLPQSHTLNRVNCEKQRPRHCTSFFY